MTARQGIFVSLASVGYRRLWAAQLGHGAALWMELVARPFVVLEVTGGAATHLGAVLSATLVPQLLFGFWAGALSDRLDRRRVLLWNRSLLVGLQAGFALLIASGHLQLWQVYVYAFARGSALAFDQPARQSLIPSLVPPGQLTNAIALMSATGNSLRVGGALAGGLLYAAIGAAGVFGLTSLASLVSAVFVARLGPRVAAPDASDADDAPGDWRDGVRYAWSRPDIRAVLLLSFAFFGFGMGYLQVFLPLFADQVLRIGSSGFGLLSSMTGAGAVVAALFLAARPPERAGSVLAAAMILFGLAMAAFALATGLPRPAGLLVPLALAGISGLAQTGFFALARSFVLLQTPDRLRGRVMGLSALERACLAAGGAGAGALASAWGVELAQLCYALACAVLAVLVWLCAPALRAARATPLGAQRLARD